MNDDAGGCAGARSIGWSEVQKVIVLPFVKQRLKSATYNHPKENVMRKPLSAAVCLVLTSLAVSASASQLSIRYKDGSVQKVRLNAPSSQITQITFSESTEVSQRGTINVVAGTYGENCGATRGNKTSHLAAQCNGKKQCNYTINYTVIGDPAVGCGKEYIAEWRCGSGEIRSTKAAAEAGFGSVVTLSCQ